MINPKNDFKSVLSFLSRRGYQIVIVHSIAEAIKKLIAVKPKIMLISWNLKNADVKKIHKLIADKFKIVCITFAEDSSTKTAAALRSSGLPNTILPPVSGPTIHMRIQNLLRREKMGSVENSATKNSSRNSNSKSGSKNELCEIQEAEISSDTVWGQPSSENMDSDGNRTWSGESKKDGKTYFFSGPKAPIFDTTKQQWTIPNRKGAILSQLLQKENEEDALREKNLQEEFSGEQNQEKRINSFDNSLSKDTVRKLRRNSSEKNELSEVMEGDVSPDTKWDQPTDENRDSEGSATWTGESKKAKKSYFFTGPKPPEFDAAKQQWSFPEKKGSIFSESNENGNNDETTQDEDPGDEFSAIQESPGSNGINQFGEGGESDDDDVDWEGELEAVKQELGELESSLQKQLSQEEDGIESEEENGFEKNRSRDFDKPGEQDKNLESQDRDSGSSLTSENAEASEQSATSGVTPIRKERTRNRRSILEQSIRDSVDSCFGPHSQESKLLTDVKQFTCLVIESSHIKGYLTCVSSDDSTNLKRIQNFIETLTGKMKNYGQPLQPMKDQMLFSLPPSNFINWSSSNSDFFCVANDVNFDIGFAFFSVPGFPKIEDADSSDVVGILLEKDILPEEKLLFDLFLHLPKNDKFIMYLSSNTVMHQKTIQKLVKFGVKTVYIKTSQIKSFLTYSARSFIHKKIT